MGIPAACTHRCNNQQNEGKMFALPENQLRPEARFVVLALLTALKGKFILMLRLYWPYEPPHVSILDGTWKPPAVKQVK
jgi:hypothetical protein